MNSKFRSAWALYVLVAFFVLAGLALGFWQMQRLTWKQAVLQNIDRMQAAPFQSLSSLKDLSLTDLGKKFQADLTYAFIEKSLMRPKEGVLGYDLIVWVREHGQLYPLFIGWVQDQTIKDKDLTEMLKILPKSMNFWISWDLKSLSYSSSFLGKDLLLFNNPSYRGPVLVAAQSVLGAKPLLIARPNNNHLSYALTWFSLAGFWVFLGFYHFRWRRRMHAKGL